MADKMNSDYWNAFYGDVLGGYTGVNALSRLPQGSAGIDPVGWTPPPPPAWNEPTSIDLAAIEKWNQAMKGQEPAMAYAPVAPVSPAVNAASSVANPVTNVTGKMVPAQPSGGLLAMLLGPSKNGLGGLAGLLGGPGQGGILGMLSDRASGPVTGDALIARATGATSAAENQAWRQKTYGGDGGSLGAS